MRLSSGKLCVYTEMFQHTVDVFIKSYADQGVTLAPVDAARFIGQYLCDVDTEDNPDHLIGQLYQEELMARFKKRPLFDFETLEPSWCEARSVFYGGGTYDEWYESLERPDVVKVQPGVILALDVPIAKLAPTATQLSLALLYKGETAMANMVHAVEAYLKS